jgi:hypothetical protein
MTVERHGSEGEMTLFCEYKESASTHADSTRIDKLVAASGGKAVQLIRHRDSSNVYQAVTPAVEDVYEVSVGALIEFFEGNGRHFRR